MPDSINGMTMAWNFSLAVENMAKPGTLIDVGANVSQVAKLLLLSCQKDTDVYSFEPIPELATIGTRFKVALSDSDGSSEFYIPIGDGELGSLYKEYANNLDAGAKTIPVEKARFDTLVEQGKIPWQQAKRPILLKVDAEGSELAVLKGFGKCLNDVDLIISEISNDPGRGRQYDWLEVSQYVGEFGFDHSRVLYACYDGPRAPAYLDVLFWRSRGETADSQPQTNAEREGY